MTIKTNLKDLLSDMNCTELALQTQAINQVWKWSKACQGLEALAYLLQSSKDDNQLMLLRYAPESTVQLTEDAEETAKANGQLIYSLSLYTGMSVCHLPQSVLTRRPICLY